MPIEIHRKKFYNDELNKNTIINKKPFTIINDQNTVSSSFEGNFTVRYVPPVNIDIFPVQLTKMLNSLSEYNVQRQACEIVYSLYRILNDLMSKEQFTNYLAKLHITEQEDKTGLIEWNFEKFRIGFSIEPDPNKSGYYFILDDYVTDTFSMKTKRFGSHIYEILEKFVHYVLENT